MRKGWEDRCGWMREPDKRLVGTAYAVIHPTGRLNEGDYSAVVSKQLRERPLATVRSVAHISSR